jgi:hypothetical protein
MTGALRSSTRQPTGPRPPKLKSVPGDWIAGDGFKAVVAEYGTDAIEYEMLARCKARADAAKRAGELGQEV